MKFFQTLIKLPALPILLASISCGGQNIPAEIDLGEVVPPESVEAVEELVESVAAAPESSAAAVPCALTDEEVSGIINEGIAETFSQGNWGVASTCTYASETTPVAIELSSAGSGDISTDRSFEGAQEIADLGDEAVWLPFNSGLTVADKSKNKLLRVRVGLPISEDERLEVAKEIARLALTKL